jgi:hypothetical protein
MDPVAPPAQTLPGSPAVPPAKVPGAGLLTAGMVISIVSLLLSWVPLLGFAGIIGAVLALVGRSRHPARPNGKAVVSCVLGLLAAVAGVACLLLLLVTMLKVMAV